MNTVTTGKRSRKSQGKDIQGVVTLPLITLDDMTQNDKVKTGMLDCQEAGTSPCKEGPQENINQSTSRSDI